MSRRNQPSGNSSGDEAIYRIPPHFYIHVLDLRTNVTKIICGPDTFVRQDNEKVVEGPTKMVILPPNYYCVVKNPSIKDAEGAPCKDEYGQVRLQHADLEVRLSCDPFPLYPGEEMSVNVTKLRAVATNTALRLRALEDFTANDGIKHLTHAQWLFVGPGTYIPRKEEEIVETIRATIIKPNEALRVKALKACQDSNKVERVCGEEWLISKVGAYLPLAYEQVVGTISAYILTDNSALHLEAIRSFKDRFGVERKSGEQWLITIKDSEAFIPDVTERVIAEVKITTLTNRQFSVIVNPMGEDGKNMLGQRRLVKGEKSFFLQPGESMEHGIQDVYILEEDEALICKALLAFKDGDIQRQPGHLWMVKGPCEFCPSVEMDVITRRKAIPLDENEGMYVRDMKSGKIRAVIGQTYILNQDEELWSKSLPEQVEKLLSESHDPLADRGNRNIAAAVARVKHKVVTYRVPHNACVQVYDYKQKKARVSFGPDLVMLDPDEQFTQLSLSGGKPKRPNVCRSLCLLLGPDFCTDIIVVETSDHARLSLQLSYNWHFDAPVPGAEGYELDAAKLFSVPDFVGDACKALASRIRGAVASVPFDDFHKNSARIIRSSVFGIDANGKVKNMLCFAANKLVITNVDIQSVEPVDQRTRDSLQKSVQLAIEITTNSQEATARHEAERLEQEARGRLERQKIMDEAEAEKARTDLLKLQALSAAVESTGQAKAEAESRAESQRIEGQAAVEQAELRSKAQEIEAESELTRLNEARKGELDYVKHTNCLEIELAKEMAGIETGKFQNMVQALGAENIGRIATSGHDNQLAMLQALGLQSTLITDGSTPLNLFNTAKGLVGALPSSSTD